ncbi:unnamed protein product [Leptosia nina]|uniref:Uncharacterized protein n=1 Tax=Leptosia nina TaxID=320188 RepID=A0AAV1IXX2_9NEOP
MFSLDYLRRCPSHVTSTEDTKLRYLLSYAIHLSPGKRHRGWRPDSAPVDVTRHRTLVAIAVCQTVDTINPNEGTEAIIGAIQLFNGPGL